MSAPDRDALLEVFRRSVPREYHDPIAQDDSYALFRAMAYLLGVLAAKGGGSLQSRYYLPHALQEAAPASSYRRAGATLRLRRRSLLAPGVVVNPGEMAIEALGRRYLSAATVRWEEGDGLDVVKELRFECEVPGTLGNLDFLAVDGLLPARVYAQADQSQGRASVRARLYTITSQLVLEDTGDPDVFVPADVGLYVELLDSAYPQNVGLVFKIIGHDWPATEHPVGSGYYPRRVFLERWPRRNPQEVFLEVAPGPTYADLTAGAIGGGQFDLLPEPGTAGDALYLLGGYPFRGAAFQLSVAGDGDWTGVWEWWDGVTWQALPELVDLTDSLRASPGEWTVRWGPTAFAPYVSPSTGVQWAAAVRMRLVAPAIVDSPRCARVLLFQELVVQYDEPGPTSGGVSWRLLDFREVGVEVIDADPFAGGRDDDLQVLGDNRGVYQQQGETDTAFRYRAARLAEVVSPDAIGAAVNNILFPLGCEGVVCDVSLLESEKGPATPNGGFDGFFLDKDPLDLYPPFAEYPVRVASVADLPAPPNGPAVVDGVAVELGDLVLLKDMANPAYNGVWVADPGGAWARDPAWGYQGRASGAGATAEEGVANAGTSWFCVADPTADVIGVDQLPFAAPDPTVPASPWILLLSREEAFGHFFVLLPYLGDGEFGLGLDDGPVLPLDDLYLGPAWDEGVLDGFPVQAAGVYSAIHSAVDKVRAAGVGFTLLRTPLLEPP